MDEDIGKRLGAVGLLQDLAASVVLVAGAWGIEALQAALFAGAPPRVLGRMLQVSEASLLLAFVFVLLRALRTVLAEFRTLQAELGALLSSPWRWSFRALRGVGRAAAIGAIVGAAVALLLNLMLAVSMVSLWLTLPVLVVALPAIFTGIAAVVHDHRAAALGRSGGAGLVMFACLAVPSLPILALVFGGLAERWTGIVGAVLGALALGAPGG